MALSQRRDPELQPERAWEWGKQQTEGNLQGLGLALCDHSYEKKADSESLRVGQHEMHSNAT